MPPGPPLGAPLGPLDAPPLGAPPRPPLLGAPLGHPPLGPHHGGGPLGPLGAPPLHKGEDYIAAWGATGRHASAYQLWYPRRCQLLPRKQM